MGIILVQPVTFPPPVLTGSGSTGTSFDISASVAPRGTYTVRMVCWTWQGAVATLNGTKGAHPCRSIPTVIFSV